MKVHILLHGPCGGAEWVWRDLPARVVAALPHVTRVVATGFIACGPGWIPPVEAHQPPTPPPYLGVPPVGYNSPPPTYYTPPPIQFDTPPGRPDTPPGFTYVPGGYSASGWTFLPPVAPWGGVEHSTAGGPGLHDLSPPTFECDEQPPMEIPVAHVSEPASLAVIMVGLFGLAFIRRSSYVTR